MHVRAPRLAIRLLTSAAVSLSAAALVAHPAAAQIFVNHWPGLTATFVQPTGTVRADEDVPVWVRLALSAEAQPFTFVGGPANGPAFGLPEGYVPTVVSPLGPGSPDPVPFARYTAASTTVAFGCDGGTFGGTAGPNAQPPSCRERAYRFFFHDPSRSPEPGFDGLTAFALRPGASFDFLVGTFRPVGGLAPAGSYVHYRILPSLLIRGLSAENRTMVAQVHVANTCPVIDRADCMSFRRDVVAATVTPEPTSIVLLAAGLGLVGTIVRRRERC